MVDVRKHYTKEQIKETWVYDTAGGRKAFEFHGPDGEYFYNLNADCVSGAKAEGWTQLLASKHVEGYFNKDIEEEG